VYPAELEGELLLHPAVQDAAVVGIPDDTWGEAGVAFIVLLPGKSASPEELASFLSKKLAKYKLPKHWRFVQSLPRTPYGKVIKGVLRDEFLAGPGT
jgi:fatty-acyl-CoA synthase